MPIIGLQFKAKVENLSYFEPSDDDFRWYLKLKCGNCGEENKQWIYLTANDHASIKGSRGIASFVIKCKFCGRENSLSILQDSISKYDNDEEKYKTIIKFDCRGVEPFDYSPREGFDAKSSLSETKFENISLEDKEWVDYDENGGAAVGIYEFEHKFIKI